MTEKLKEQLAFRISAEQLIYLQKTALKKGWSVGKLMRTIIEELRTGGKITKRPDA